MPLIKLLSLSFCVFCFAPLYGQNESDLYRYSKSGIYGDSRFEAMGGAFGALGANLSCSQINPAGFGRYSQRQIGGAMGFETRDHKIEFEGTKSESSNFLGHLNSLGVVLVSDESKNREGFVFSQFGLGFNRLKGFKNTYEYTGVTNVSLLNSISNQAQGFDPSELYLNFPFSTSMAWETYAINYDDSTRTYHPLLNGPNSLTRKINEKGGMNEVYLSGSGNYLNKLYIGGNMGIRFVNFKQDVEHREVVINPNNQTITAFDYINKLNVQGAGINIKLGFIYLPVDQLRLGFAIHSPTFFELEDVYSANMTTYFADTTIPLQEAFVPKGKYKYRLRTPGKAIGSIAYVFGTSGCISTDIEYVAYRMSHFRTTTDEGYSTYDYIEENKNAKKAFTPGVNIRIGGEYVINGIFFIRAGFAMLSNAYKRSYNIETNFDIAISGGFGVRFTNFTLDFSASKTVLARNYMAFDQSTANITSQLNRLTIGATYFIR